MFTHSLAALDIEAYNKRKSVWLQGKPGQTVNNESSSMQVATK